MGFMVTSLIFSVVGIIASLCTRICFNRGPSTNLLHLTLVVTATVCCWMISTYRLQEKCPFLCRSPCLCTKASFVVPTLSLLWWAIVYLAQMKPLIVPILSEGE
ncbi:V-type proton ATPase subunit e2 isoform X1 [Rhododendron vialii]|uniref:V-type proton ATPase subunit e2 isoform X1 n=1 Tax=Rhododendron vialii TaxID=182163 RepID=UPI00265F1CF9|nr:V-type proton ATPase subunit e2 isoform X1 [Rhododendron vialii]XP_058209968.1 V-type proton ATPase subunit e2 isoform X1 [Rhododendron vialii]XP_058209969.1 V-type proton ATPase subunit e2 isoform X1 [Rhododendron vialii]